MNIEHVAIWAKDIEKLRSFYIKYFNAESNDKYVNTRKSFESYFLTFSSGSRLELMQMPEIPANRNNAFDQYHGIIHIAFSVGSRQKVVELTEQLMSDGYEIVSQPRETGDGYFESCILDPEKNRIEITS
jgi:lactoylglutathione lyase